MTSKLALILLFLTTPLFAQQTIFNVPSADVLGRGKVYGELDLTFHPSPWAFTAEPRVVVGAGHGVEVGVNVPGFNSPQDSEVALSPAIKWKPYDNARNGWALFLGDNLFFPAQRRRYNAGNYAYAAAAKTLHTGTRLSFGAYDFTPHVIDRGNRAGAQLGLEQPAKKELKLIADWFSGATNYFTGGALLQATPRFSFYAGYQLGNSGLARGNHGVEIELGWNFN